MAKKSSEGAASRPPEAEPTAEQVEAFLRRHPDFLSLRPELLAVLEPPKRWTEEGVVDLQSYLIRQQRAEVARLQESRQELIDASRAYLSNQNRTQAAVLALIGAHGREALTEALTADLPMRLDIDAVALCFEKTDEAQIALAGLPVRWLDPGEVGRVLPEGREVNLIEVRDDARVLFGEAAGLASSAGAVRLDALQGDPPGLLALGSRSADDFKPGRATDHLAFLGTVLDTCLRGAMSARAPAA